MTKRIQQPETQPAAATPEGAEIQRRADELMALAVQNARLFEAEQRQRQLAESLREVAFVLSSSLDKATVIAKILEQLGRVISSDGAALFLQEGEDLVLVAGNSIKPSLIGTHLPVSHPNPGARVFRQKSLIIVDDVKNDPGWEIWFEAYPIRSWMGAPLFVGEKAIGVLTTDNFKVNTYTVEDGQNLQTFANHAAVAIENARLFEAAEKANRELSIRAHEIMIFNDAIQMMNRTTDLISALQGVAEIIVNFLEARNCGIALLNDAKTELEVVVSASLDDRYPSTVGTKIPVTDNPSSRHVIETCHSLVIAQPQQHSLTTPLHELLRQLNTQCLMIVPLLARGEVIGTIGVDTERAEREFSPAEVRFVETMAGQIAGAVGIARLFEAEQRQRFLAEQHSQELEAVNTSLRATNAELDAFAHTVAHDLKNPLGALTTYGDLLVSYGLEMPPRELQIVFQELQRSGQKANNIVEELLLLASVRRKGSVTLKPLDMAQIVEEVQRRLSFMIADHRAEIIHPSNWPRAVGYAPWIEEVWVNYLSNGLKYGGQPPRLELGATHEENGTIRFWVRDNGPGLPPEAQARLFAEFTRLDEIRARGHGLGLSIAQRIVAKLGGQVGVESDNTPGQGCIFYFTLAAG
jgi:signal transduction histidine kinase